MTGRRVTLFDKVVRKASDEVASKKDLREMGRGIWLGGRAGMKVLAVKEHQLVSGTRRPVGPQEEQQEMLSE